MLNKKLEIINFKKTLFFMVVSNLLLTLHVHILTILVSLVPILYCYNFKKIFRENEKHLRENFTINLIFKSIFEISIFLAISIYGLLLIKSSKVYIWHSTILLLICTLLVITRFLELTYKANDIQSRFFAATNNIGDINQDINIFWRLKLWFTPRFDIKNLRKNNNYVYGNYGFEIFFLSLLVIKGIQEDDYVLMILGIVILLGIFLKSFLDKILNTFIKFDGVCLETKIEYASKSNRVSGCKYRIVDFHNRREISMFIDTDEIPRYKNGDKITVIHGIFSKKVIDHYVVVKQ